jgi:peroxiredoxin family protein
MPKISIILFSGTVDKLMPVGVLASSAAATGMDVEIFATFWGLMSLRRDMAMKNVKVSKEYEDVADEMFKIMRERNVPSWLDMIREAKKLGNVKVYACAMTFDMFGMKREDLVDIVDEVVGAGEYLDKAKDADITLFI